MPLLGLNKQIIALRKILTLGKMAYWRNYRKFRAEAQRMAEYNSSDEDMDTTECTMYPSNSNSNSNEIDRNLDDIAKDNQVLHDYDSCYENEQLSNSSISDCDHTRSDTDDDTVGTCSDWPTEITLCQKLSTWAVKNKCQRRTVNELLEILRAEGHNLPIDSRTLLATPREIPILTKCCGDYIYFGIEQGNREVLSKNLSFIEKNKTIDLKVNIDGLPLMVSIHLLSVKHNKHDVKTFLHNIHVSGVAIYVSKEQGQNKVGFIISISYMTKNLTPVIFLVLKDTQISTFFFRQ